MNDHKANADSHLKNKDYFSYMHQLKLQFESTNLKEDKENYEKARKLYDLYKEIQKVNSLNEKDYCKIMGVDKNINQNDLKKKYNALIMKYHPDKAKIEGSNEAYLRVRKAYEVLKNKCNKNEFRTKIESESEENIEEFLREMREFQRRCYYTRPRNINIRTERGLSTEACFLIIIILFWLIFAM